MLKGVDISSFQGEVNFDQLKTEVDFVIIKATEGVGFTDPQFLRNQAEARRIGTPVGYYHFARPDLGNTPESESDWFKQTIGELKSGEILFLDLEVNFPNSVDWCRGFLDHLSFLLGGYKPLIYLNLSLVSSNDWSSVINENYGLWLAHYDDNENQVDTTPWAEVAFKQFTSSESVPSITGNVDQDAFYGDQTAFLKYGYQVSLPSPSVPPPYSSEQCIIDSYTAFCGVPPSDDEKNYKLQELEKGKNMVDLFNELKGDSRFVSNSCPKPVFSVPTVTTTGSILPGTPTVVTVPTPNPNNLPTDVRFSSPIANLLYNLAERIG